MQLFRNAKCLSVIEREDPDDAVDLCQPRQEVLTKLHPCHYLSWTSTENKICQILTVVTANKTKKWAPSNSIYSLETLAGFPTIWTDYPVMEMAPVWFPAAADVYPAAQLVTRNRKKNKPRYVNKSTWNNNNNISTIKSPLSKIHAGTYADPKQHREDIWQRGRRLWRRTRSGAEHSRSPGHDDHTQAQLETIKTSYSSSLPFCLHLLSLTVAPSHCTSHLTPQSLVLFLLHLLSFFSPPLSDYFLIIPGPHTTERECPLHSPSPQ